MRSPDDPHKFLPLANAVGLARIPGSDRFADSDRILEEGEGRMMETALRILGATGAIVAVIGVGLLAYAALMVFFNACEDIEKIRKILEKKPKRRKR